ncbi:TetR/AcrR family transcriptional regulator [Clostridium sardiniense]|uniref:TetR/AcrR family transcriptional regulator n=1 Tax=Clostridium sardiniense TaxID=29369 RepID=A0ABS7KTP4_CLOSR|nr:TetR/AcrR family transcriptional regulator [Clostridium sardiniense]MBY0754176.1 TetR/AcrR family transcriptional regulator [Clostridium sardiniense]MDQ0459297.1 AcrR family transcriptional regulator [Clostridium sardiniense]
MNQKFFNLPNEKQKAIIDAGYRVFSENKYKKSPMSEISAEAGISKSLLFHYFNNKKEFYLYLYDYGTNLILEVANKESIFNETDFFKLYLQGAKCKLGVFEKHPYLFSFMVRAYYEDEQEVVADIAQRNSSMIQFRDNNFLRNLDRNKFKDDIDIEELFNMITWCVEGYMKEKCKGQPLDLNDLEEGYIKMLDFFKRNSYKEEYLR